MSRCEIGVFGAPLEELQEKPGVHPQLQVFFGVGVAGAEHVWHDSLVELVEFLEWSSPKHPRSGHLLLYPLIYLFTWVDLWCYVQKVYCIHCKIFLTRKE